MNTKIVTDLTLYLTTIVIENIIIVQHFCDLSLLAPVAVGKKTKKNDGHYQRRQWKKRMAEKKKKKWSKIKKRRESNPGLHNKLHPPDHYTASSFMVIPDYTVYILKYLVF